MPASTATAATSFASKLDSLMTREVMGPWQQECLDATHPWEATPALRTKWLDQLRTGDAVEALAGAIAISRCARLTDIELEAANRYFVTLESMPIAKALIYSFLLSGASPPLAIYPTYFNPILCANESPPAGFWDLFASFVRHPFYANLGSLVLNIGLPGPFVPYLIMTNPAGAPKFLPAFQDDIWFRSLFYFRIRKTELPSEPQAELSEMAILLRTDATRLEHTRRCREAALDESLLFIQTEHPCLFQGAAPEFDPTNPDRDAIRYFGADGGVCSVWRYHNPLLNYPWLVDNIAETDRGGIYLALSLLGMPVTSSRSHPVYDSTGLRSLLDTHPSSVLAERYLRSE